MLRAPDGAVVGCRDLDEAAAFFTHFSLVASGPEQPLDAASAQALYGLSAPSAQRRLSAPGAARGGVRLVKTPHDRSRRSAFEPQGFAIDVYARGIDGCVEQLRDAGLPTSDVVRWRLGDGEFAEARVEGPGGIRVVLVDGTLRRPSLLDTDPQARFSEVQAVVFLVGDAAADDAFWTGAGLDRLRSSAFPAAPVAGLLDLPDPGADMHLSLYWQANAPGGSVRVELISFPGRSAPGTAAVRPLVSGTAAVAFAVDHLPDRLGGASLGPIVETAAAGCAARCRAGVSPAGVPFELWEVA